MRRRILFVLPILYLFSLTSVLAEVERDQIIFSVLDVIEQKIGSQGTDNKADYQQREKAIAQALQQAKEILVSRPSQQKTDLVKAKTELIQPSPLRNFLSDFYCYSPFQILFDNLTAFSSFLYFYDYGDLVWTSPQLNRHKWEFGSEIYHFNYKEPNVMKDEGMFYGVTASYTSRGELMSKLFMLTLEGRGSWGEVDYENSGTIDDIDDYALEFRGLGGYSFPVLASSILTPYVGLGYRYLNDDASGRVSSTNALGYERESKYVYIPVGIEGITELGRGWTIALTMEYDYFLMGEQTSHLSDAVSTYNDVENDQEVGYGTRGSIRLQKNGDKIDLIIEPFIRYWYIKKSEVESVTLLGGVIWGYGWEPKNNTTEIGGKFAIKF